MKKTSETTQLKQWQKQALAEQEKDIKLMIDSNTIPNNEGEFVVNPKWQERTIRTLFWSWNNWQWISSQYEKQKDLMEFYEGKGRISECEKAEQISKDILLRVQEEWYQISQQKLVYKAMTGKEYTAKTQLELESVFLTKKVA
jgi:hypothetical protein